MKIAILSDSHDHIGNLREAVAACTARGCAALIHCGDLISPFMLQELARFRGAIHLIHGNNLGDLLMIGDLLHSRFPFITHHGASGAIEAGGLRIAFHHYPQLGRALAASGQFDLVCCGHNHCREVAMVGTTLLVNPGELLGKDEQPGFVIVDSGDRSWETVTVGQPFR
ncbi:MAG: YfcE family phosphodiesterase [Thermodesulfobacteriota bacterium]